MHLRGACHCSNIEFQLQWPGNGSTIPVRECGCTFCRKHAGAWTSNPDGDLQVTIRDDMLVSRYRFGTATAEFLVCSTCGVVPTVVSEIEGRLHAVVNVNTLEDRDSLTLARSPTDFDGEGKADRLARRQRNWIPRVRISQSGV